MPWGRWHLRSHERRWRRTQPPRRLWGRERPAWAWLRLPALGRSPWSRLGFDPRWPHDLDVDPPEAAFAVLTLKTIAPTPPPTAHLLLGHLDVVHDPTHEPLLDLLAVTRLAGLEPGHLDPHPLSGLLDSQQVVDPIRTALDSSSSKGIVEVDSGLLLGLSGLVVGARLLGGAPSTPLSFWGSHASNVSRTSPPATKAI